MDFWTERLPLLILTITAVLILPAITRALLESRRALRREGGQSPARELLILILILTMLTFGMLLIWIGQLPR